jgi:excisionase family DNA binding protein
VPEDEFLTVAEIATILKMNPQTIRNWIDAGSLPAFHVGRRVRVRRADFEALLARGHMGPDRSGPSEAQRFWDGDWHPTPVVPES